MKDPRIPQQTFTQGVESFEAPASYESLEKYIEVCRINLKIAKGLKDKHPSKQRWIESYSDIINRYEASK